MFIDSHCHLDFEEFDGDRTALIQKCYELGVNKFVIPATVESGWEKIERLSQQYLELYYALGLHPIFLSEDYKLSLSRLERLLENKSSRCIAIGEIGIDYHCDIDPNLQHECFEAQIYLAQTFKLPVLVHHRKSHNDVHRWLKRFPVPQGGIIHAFSGSYTQGKNYIDMGFKLGIGGLITYERAQKTHKALKKFPLDALVLETDCPDMPLSGQQGKRNSPLNIPLIAQALCQLREESEEAILEQVYQNTLDILPGLKNAQ